MKWKYLCPHCKAILNPNVKIVLAVQRGRKSGLMLLSPRPGNYRSICDPEFGAMLQDGQVVTFACPVCRQDLTSHSSQKLAELHLVQPGQKAKRIQFSRVYGEHATFVLDGDKVVPYGADAELYDSVNFFGV